jgi:hypothetical protein
MGIDIVFRDAQPCTEVVLLLFLGDRRHDGGWMSSKVQTSSAVARTRFLKGARSDRRHVRPTVENKIRAPLADHHHNPFATPVGCAVMTSLVAPAAHFWGGTGQDIESPKFPIAGYLAFV